MEPRDWWNPHLKMEAEKYWLAKSPELEEQARDLRERWAKKEGKTYHIPNDQTFWAMMEPDVRAFQDSMLTAKKAMWEKSFEMTADDTDWSVLSAALATPKPRKQITSVGWETKYDDVDVTSIEDHHPKTMRGSSTTTWTDQDGDPLPRELAVDVEIAAEKAARRGESQGDAIQDVLDDWNRGRRAPVPSSWQHQKSCPYRGDSSFPCTCHPPSLFGETKLWYCDCCDEPRSALQHGLCEMCEAHQYSDARQADLEHQAMSEDT